MFPSCENEEDTINPGIWGQRLADYLCEHLAEKGYRITDVDGEDWGWAVRIENEAFPLGLGCSNLDGEDNAYRVFIEPSKPIVRVGLFKKVDTTATVKKLANTLETILKADPEILNVKWVEL